MAVAIKQVPVRHTETGATGSIPESALQHFPGWVRTDVPAEPDAPAEPEAPTDTEPPADGGTTKKGARRG